MWGKMDMAIGSENIFRSASAIGMPALIILVITVALASFANAAQAESPQKTLIILTAVEKDSVTPGDTQTVYVVVLGADGKPLSNSSASALVIFGRNLDKVFNGTTGSDGVWSFSWKIGNHSRTGLQGIDIKVNSQGYDTEYTNLVFPVFRS